MYIEIWNRVSNTIDRGFDSESVYNKNIKKKKINTDFYNDKMPKEGSHCICLSVKLIDSVFRVGKNYYPQVFLEECKYVSD